MFINLSIYAHNQGYQLRIIYLLPNIYKLKILKKNMGDILDFESAKKRKLKRTIRELHDKCLSLAGSLGIEIDASGRMSERETHYYHDIQENSKIETHYYNDKIQN